MYLARMVKWVPYRLYQDIMPKYDQCESHIVLLVHMGTTLGHNMPFEFYTWFRPGDRNISLKGNFVFHINHFSLQECLSGYLWTFIPYGSLEKAAGDEGGGKCR